MVQELLLRVQSGMTSVRNLYICYNKGKMSMVNRSLAELLSDLPVPDRDQYLILPQQSQKELATVRNYY